MCPSALAGLALCNRGIQQTLFPVLVSRKKNTLRTGLAGHSGKVTCCDGGRRRFLREDARSRGFYRGTHLEGIALCRWGGWRAIYSNITRHLLPHAKLFSSCSMKRKRSWTLLSEAFQPRERNLSLLRPLALFFQSAPRVGVTIRSPDPSELLNVGKVAQ